MSHTYTSNRVHIIFSTKGRENRLAEDLQPKLWAYIAGIAKNHGFEAIKIGGAGDHCHCLVLLPAAMPLCKAVQTLKGCSSKYSRTSQPTTLREIMKKSFSEIVEEVCNFV